MSSAYKGNPGSGKFKAIRDEGSFLYEKAAQEIKNLCYRANLDQGICRRQSEIHASCWELAEGLSAKGLLSQKPEGFYCRG
jgi:hypothetical protein